jgi:Lrp/AsnC family transcriptional regulator for asnA, asnC and gidA
MKNPRKLDKLDRKILRIITGNARMPFKDVADECGVSRAAVHQRVLRMMENKAVTGSGYHVSPEALGYRSCTYIGVKLERGSLYKDVVPEFEKIPEVVECHFTTGPYTLLVKVYARDNEHLMELINTRIQEIQGVTNTETMISLHQDIKRDIPVQDVETDIDDEESSDYPEDDFPED